MYMYIYLTRCMDAVSAVLSCSLLKTLRDRIQKKVRGISEKKKRCKQE